MSAHRFFACLGAMVLCLGVSAREFNERKVVLNLAVLSDTHVDGPNTVPAYKFRSALIQARDFAALYGGLDGVLLAGDLVDSPAWNATKYTQIDDWKRLYESVFSPLEVPMVYAVGNHDIWKEWTPNTYREAKQFTRRFGPDYYRTDVGDPEMRDSLECRHCVIGDCHILCVTPDGRDPVVYPEAVIRWLDETLAQITTEHPDRYVLILTHAMVYHTVYGSELDDTYPKGNGYWSTRVLTDVLKKDTVVNYNGNRYHLYVAINPTKYKVVRHTLNEDGLDVENVYYDNIIHLSIFQGDRQLFSRDFRKQQYQQRVPAQFFDQAVLNNMEYSGADEKGLHFNVSLCTPGDASCYLLEHVVSLDGQLTTELVEY